MTETLETSRTMHPLCERCRGACCEVLRVEAPTDEHREWLTGRAAAFGADERGSFVLVRCRCAWLTSEGRCSVYDRRPSFCRVLEPGGADCLTVREALRPACDRSRNAVNNFA